MPFASVLSAWLLLSLVTPQTVHAQPAETPEINAAQQLVFLDGHLGETRPGNVLSYRFERRTRDGEGFTDSVRMFVTAAGDDERRDLRFDFLSGPNHIDFQATQGYVGNPLIILFLERDIRDMSRDTGGSAAHFRNRIRQSFETPRMDRTVVEHEGRRLEATRVSVTPFRDDPFIDRFRDYASKRYDFVFSAQIPGVLYRIHTETPGLEGEPVEELTFVSID